MCNSKNRRRRAAWLVGENASLSGMHRWRAIHLCMGGMPGGTEVDASDHPYVGPCGIPAQPITTMSETKLDATTCSYPRSEEHTSELQSLMRISYAVFCLKKKTKQIRTAPLTTLKSHQ